MAHMQRSEDNVGCQSITFYQVSCFLLCILGLAGPWVSRDSPALISHLATGTLGLQMHAAIHALTRIMRIQTQALKLSWKAFYPLNYNSSPVTSSFTFRNPPFCSLKTIPLTSPGRLEHEIPVCAAHILLWLWLLLTYHITAYDSMILKTGVVLL